jgi:hypothetical protein
MQKPLCVQINDALLEIGGLRVKQAVQAMMDAGITTDEINEHLKYKIIPAFEDWRFTQLNQLMRVLNDDAPTETRN